MTTIRTYNVEAGLPILDQARRLSIGEIKLRREVSALQIFTPSRASTSQPEEPDMRGKRLQWAFIAVVLTALALGLAGCVYPQGYSDWQWKQYNPNYRPLPGDQNY